MRPRADRIIWMATRTQGLIVMPGNPKEIVEIADLASPEVRFINRQRDSGTRILLDQLLAEVGVAPAEVRGYESEEYTHSAVAVHVASGLADVGLGIEAAAAQFKLGFVPLVAEQYFFAVRSDALQRPAVQAFITLLGSEPFRRIVNGLPGYRADRSGEVAEIADTAPWNELLAAPSTGPA
ncbi:MAG TPA: substrate-binding domain-containing protein [Burkholderiales bacterium]|nr:substrate-binding domain-containing protein [Burkholderiales bacterium]